MPCLAVGTRAGCGMPMRESHGCGRGWLSPCVPCPPPYHSRSNDEAVLTAVVDVAQSSDRIQSTMKLSNPMCGVAVAHVWHTLALEAEQSIA